MGDRDIAVMFKLCGKAAPFGDRNMPVTVASGVQAAQSAAIGTAEAGFDGRTAGAPASLGRFPIDLGDRACGLGTAMAIVTDAAGNRAINSFQSGCR